ncbi:amino acid--tRNA ligase-related protein [Mycoplasma sp. SG1]|uniref:amino acid--tRNA ligase-related protein n=1 Tax=Mycoplasma sp. SG1 TaxID=2810348 RepID=UPI0020254C18|nr:amino acid--tRNA ligase-related protein [Mycoplasma sp. SG1]URM53066.1 hypothetical protein JRW51_01830 [Mycoplasma sp. SG1]
MKNLKDSSSFKAGEISNKLLDKNLKVEGYIKQIRIFKNLVFIDLYSSYGLTQVFFKKERLKSIFYLFGVQKIDIFTLIKNDQDNNLFSRLKNLSLEIPIATHGIVKKRLSPNINIPNGDIEIDADTIEIHQLNHFLNLLNNQPASENIPFLPEHVNDVLETTKLKYRYLELRNNKIQQLLKKRSLYNQFIRQYFLKQDFIEVETPILTSPTVEGARSFIVPSFNLKGQFFALPQSPQIYKQMLMISGVDRYFQIARCFRAEDLRENRQLEFTQLDIELSFVKSKTFIINLIDSFLIKFLTEFVPERLSISENHTLTIIDYYDALINYGTDKPDFRFQDQNLIHTFFYPFHIDNKDLKTDPLLKNKEYFVIHQPHFSFVFILGHYLFSLFKKNNKFWKENNINTLSWFFVKDQLSKNEELLDSFILFQQQNKMKNFFYLEINSHTKQIDFFNHKKHLISINYEEFNPNLFKDILFLEKRTNNNGLKTCTLVFDIATDLNDKFFTNLGFLRKIYLNYLVKYNSDLQKLIKWVWVVNWPTLKKDEITDQTVFLHHPFTKYFLPILPENVNKENILKTINKNINFNNKKAYFSHIFDIVINGEEIGGGSLRCHDKLLQQKIFAKISSNLDAESKKIVKESFSFFIHALNWAPPHGGIALGLDRLYGLINDCKSIRDIIPFPKTSKGSDILFNNPLKLNDKLLKEWKLK